MISSQDSNIWFHNHQKQWNRPNKSKYHRWGIPAFSKLNKSFVKLRLNTIRVALVGALCELKPALFEEYLVSDWTVDPRIFKYSRSNSSVFWNSSPNGPPVSALLNLISALWARNRSSSAWCLPTNHQVTIPNLRLDSFYSHCWDSYKRSQANHRWSRVRNNSPPSLAIETAVPVPPWTSELDDGFICVFHSSEIMGVAPKSSLVGGLPSEKY